MVTFRLVSGKGEVTHCFLIICRFFFAFYGVIYYRCDFCQGFRAEAT